MLLCPFIIEGIIQGFFGSIVSIIFLAILNSFQVYFMESIINSHLIIPSIIIPSNIILGSFDISLESNIIF